MLLGKISTTGFLFMEWVHKFNLPQQMGQVKHRYNFHNLVPTPIGCVTSFVSYPTLSGCGTPLSMFRTYSGKAIMEQHEQHDSLLSPVSASVSSHTLCGVLSYWLAGYTAEITIYRTRQR